MIMEYKLTYNQFMQGLEQEKLLGLVCDGCGAATCPPLGVCRACGGQELRVAEMNGVGTLRTFTVVRVAPEGRTPPYVVAMVELDEGPWVMGNLEGLPLDQSNMDIIGKKVKVGSRRVQTKLPVQENQRSLTFHLI